MKERCQNIQKYYSKLTCNVDILRQNIIENLCFLNRNHALSISIISSSSESVFHLFLWILRPPLDLTKALGYSTRSTHLTHATVIAFSYISPSALLMILYWCVASFVASRTTSTGWGLTPHPSAQGDPWWMQFFWPLLSFSFPQVRAWRSPACWSPNWRTSFWPCENVGHHQIPDRNRGFCWDRPCHSPCC